ncbi:MAG: peptidylprolyl isomerase [Candidatus Neomarinimicrobiota bacterium]|nr:peptidylprolyl isomerase [Candidatus Neomarinimicrobiota bacterium]
MIISCAGQPEEYALIATEKGNIYLKFLPDVAPKHVESFKTLAREGYFNGTDFHRVIAGFIIQGGDPNSKDGDRLNDGLGGRAGKYYGIGDKDNPNTWRLPAEFSSLPHNRGTLSMARSPSGNDTAGSQFFICIEPRPSLNNQYTIFGEVVQGINVVDSIAAVFTPRKRNPNYERPDGDSPIMDVFMDVHIGTAEELGIELSSE